jgi:hypothetical protein
VLRDHCWNKPTNERLANMSGTSKDVLTPACHETMHLAVLEIGDGGYAFEKHYIVDGKKETNKKAS